MSGIPGVLSAFRGLSERVVMPPLREARIPPVLGTFPPPGERMQRHVPTLNEVTSHFYVRFGTDAYTASSWKQACGRHVCVQVERGTAGSAYSADLAFQDPPWPMANGS